MTAVPDNLIMQKIEKNIDRGKKLGVIKGSEKPDIETLLDIDIIWHILDISHKMEASEINKDEVHKMMLQYGNLNKIRLGNRQMRAKTDDRAVLESNFDKIVREYAEKDKAGLEKKKSSIVKKVMTDRELSPEEQDIVDAMAEAQG